MKPTWRGKIGWMALSVGLCAGCSGGESPTPQGTTGPGAPTATVSPLEKEVQNNTQDLAAQLKASLSAPDPSAQALSTSSGQASVAGQPAGPIALSPDVANLQKMLAAPAGRE